MADCLPDLFPPAMPAPTAIVIEDEPQIRRFVRGALEAEGWQVHEAATQREGLAAAGTRRPDLLVLDLGLPDGDGLDLIRDVRSWSAVPIIVLSARVDEVDKIAALDAGADDYLTKPFAFDELIARVRALLRRSDLARPTVMSVGTLALDPVSHMVTQDGMKIDLTQKEYALLHILMRHAGEVVSRARIAEQIWKDDLLAIDNLIDVHMGNLRRKIDPALPPWIQTVRGRGFRLSADTPE